MITNKIQKFKEQAFAWSVGTMPDITMPAKEVVANVIAGSKTLAGLTPVLGVKANTSQQLATFSNGVNWNTADCVVTPTGTTSILPRNLDAVRLTDREEYCLDELDRAIPAMMKSGAYNDEVSFENVIVDNKIKNNAKTLEKLAFQGSITGGTGNMGVTNGWVEIAKQEYLSLDYYATFTGFSASNAMSLVEGIINDRSEAMREVDDYTIWMSQSYYAILAKALLTAYGIFGAGQFVNTGSENQTGAEEMIYPGTNVKIKATHGLNTANHIFATNESNLTYGTDLENDKEKVEVFFSQYHKRLVTDLVFTMAFQYYFPENVSLLRKI